jgi:hypothetical protein
LFGDWFKKQFYPSVQNYFKQNNLTFKIILVLEIITGSSAMPSGSMGFIEHVLAMACRPEDSFNFQGSSIV